MPRIVKFPDCCRARIFHSFGGHGANYGHRVIDGQKPEHVRNYLLNKINDLWSINFFFAILNPKQQVLYEKILLEVGFKCVSSCPYTHWNRTKGDIKVYIYTREKR